ncbi:GtrA family protein [uncultured Azohydromonas sp.]|uniref:GtrA family protein n=1 Tax=uncultured Azohydromonas sp. TaxID=487342 RepID=UPI00262AB9B4|nr:GtrA family protein [uncultured Azohydromonas sp.]
MSFTRYTAVGGLATAVHYALLALLVEAVRVPPAAAAALGALAGAVLAYAGNRRFTFRDVEVCHRRTLPRFLTVAALSAALNSLLVALGTALGEHYLLAQAQSTAAGLVLGYGLNKRWSFVS